MGLKFRLRGLAETFLDNFACPCCGNDSGKEDDFDTAHTKVTYEGIIVVLTCKKCGEIFLPQKQKNGVIDSGSLRSAVIADAKKTGRNPIHSKMMMRIEVEKLNAERNGEIQ